MTFEVLSDKNTNLKEFEQKFALELPGDYKSFLSKHNGISIEEGCISIKDIDEEVMMNVLFSSDRSLSRALTLDFWNSEYGEDIPGNSALIGDFQDGSFLLLIAEGEDKGVYYYDHAYILDESGDDCNTYFLADSFNHFMERLEKYNRQAEV